jgi:hypothetical protein
MKGTLCQEEMYNREQSSIVRIVQKLRLMNEKFFFRKTDFNFRYRNMNIMPVIPETRNAGARILPSKVESKTVHETTLNVPIKIPRKTDCVRSIDTFDSSADISGRVRNLSLIYCSVTDYRTLN